MMHFFKDNAGTTSLARWMRVVWNIIENSTIDSDDTYHAALKLIKQLSSKSNDIYNALANDFDSFKLGDRYHAQEQVKEEIAKAKQILNGSPRHNGECWENIIINAEKSAFFKGAIRFLFTDGEGNTDWNDFSKKWENAQTYFDKNGVKDNENCKYRTNAILLKAVLYHINDFWKYIEPQKFVFDNKPETWKTNILLAKGFENAVHNIMIGNLDIMERRDDCLMYKNLYLTNLLDYVANFQVGSRIRWIHGYRAIYPPRCEGIILDDDKRGMSFYRNKILSSLYQKGMITSKQEINNYTFFKGWDVNFQYKEFDFQWNTDGKVYMKENLTEYYCCDAKDVYDVDVLCKRLDDLIEQVSLGK